MKRSNEGVLHVAAFCDVLAIFIAVCKIVLSLYWWWLALQVLIKCWIHFKRLSDQSAPLWASLLRLLFSKHIGCAADVPSTSVGRHPTEFESINAITVVWHWFKVDRREAVLVWMHPGIKLESLPVPTHDLPFCTQLWPCSRWPIGSHIDLLVCTAWKLGLKSLSKHLRRGTWCAPGYSKVMQKKLLPYHIKNLHTLFRLYFVFMCVWACAACSQRWPFRYKVVPVRCTPPGQRTGSTPSLSSLSGVGLSCQRFPPLLVYPWGCEAEGSKCRGPRGARCSQLLEDAIGLPLLSTE